MHELEKKVLELIGESTSSPDVFTDDELGMAPIRDSLNDAIQEISMLIGSNKRQYFIPLRAGQQIYQLTLPYGYVGWVADVWLVNKQYRLEQTGIIKVTSHDPRWMISSGEPRAYFPIGNDVICLYPKPSASSDTLEVTVVEIPVEYTSGNSKIKLKSDFQYAAVHYAVSEYWASRGDAKEATTHYTLYADVMKLNKDFHRSPQRSSRFETNKGPFPSETT